MKIIGQQGDHRFLLDAGEADGLRMGRIYDEVQDKVSAAMPVDSILSHSPGFEPPTLSSEILAEIEANAAKL